MFERERIVFSFGGSEVNMRSLLLSVPMTCLAFGVQGQPVEQTGAAHKQAAFMPTYEDASPPPGYVQFCQKNVLDCLPTLPSSASAPRAVLDGLRLEELESVNSLVNKMIRPVSDIELYGQREYWTYPVMEGDCEDYVLLKRRMLIARGWPVSALLITVVRDEDGEGHAVLTVTTDRGDLILDNKQSVIKAWYETPYRYIKRQSPEDPLIWVALSPEQNPTENYAGVPPETPERNRTPIPREGNVSVPER
jgi:predicted transglutaminase-like cysteine proteinase